MKYVYLYPLACSAVAAIYSPAQQCLTCPRANFLDESHPCVNSMESTTYALPKLPYPYDVGHPPRM